MQNRLRDLGYLKSAADGDFGTETKAALIAFQTANRLTADGKATAATLSKLYAADAKDAKTFAEEQKDAEDAKKEEDVESQDPEDATDIEVGGYTTLRQCGVAQRKLTLAQHKDIKDAVEIECGIDTRDTCTDYHYIKSAEFQSHQPF